MICTVSGVDFVSNSINATFTLQGQKSVIMIAIMKDELMEDIEYFGISIDLSPTDVSSVAFRSGNITLSVGVILDYSGEYIL